MSGRKTQQEKGGRNKFAALAILIILVMSVFLVFAPGLFNGASQREPLEQEQASTPSPQIGVDDVAVIETNMGTIVFKFHPEVAPKTVENFIKLADSKFYDGILFHRVIPDFMVQGGDPNSRNPDKSMHGLGGPGYNVPAEFSSLKHRRGMVSMARRGDDINSAGSQFFIVVRDSFFLDGQYTIFGEVIEGMDMVDNIANARTDSNDNPLAPVVMERVYIRKG